MGGSAQSSLARRQLATAPVREQRELAAGCWLPGSPRQRPSPAMGLSIGSRPAGNPPWCPKPGSGKKLARLLLSPPLRSAPQLQTRSPATDPRPNTLVRQRAPRPPPRPPGEGAAYLGAPLRRVLHHRLAEAIIHVGRHRASLRRRGGRSRLARKGGTAERRAGSGLERRSGASGGRRRGHPGGASAQQRRRPDLGRGRAPEARGLPAGRRRPAEAAARSRSTRRCASRRLAPPHPHGHLRRLPSKLLGAPRPSRRRGSCWLGEAGPRRGGAGRGGAGRGGPRGAAGGGGLQPPRGALCVLPAPATTGVAVSCPGQAAPERSWRGRRPGPSWIAPKQG